MRVPIFFHRSPISFLFLCLALAGFLVTPATAAPEPPAFTGIPDRLEIRGTQAVLDFSVPHAVGGVVNNLHPVEERIGYMLVEVWEPWMPNPQQTG